MQNLRAWLEDVEALCGKVLHEPTSGLHKMNLVLALRRSRRVLEVPTGRGQKVDQLAAHLVETASTVKLQIWDAPVTFRHQYLERVRKMVEQLRCEVIELLAEIEGTQNNPGTSLSLPLSSHGTLKKSAAGISKASGMAFLWSALTKALRKVAKNNT